MQHIHHFQFFHFKQRVFSSCFILASYPLLTHIYTPSYPLIIPHPKPEERKKIHSFSISLLSSSLVLYTSCLIFVFTKTKQKKYVWGLGVQEWRVSIGRESSSRIGSKAWEEEDVGSLAHRGSGNFLCFS